MGGSHSVPNNQQIGPLLEENKAMWQRFTQAATISVISIFILLGLMAVFLLERH